MNYSNWSMHALQGYLVMTDALLSGTISQNIRQDYITKMELVVNEINSRDTQSIVSKLAYPEETYTSGSILYSECSLTIHSFEIGLTHHRIKHGDTFHRKESIVGVISNNETFSSIVYNRTSFCICCDKNAIDILSHICTVICNGKMVPSGVDEATLVRCWPADAGVDVRLKLPVVLGDAERERYAGR